MKLTKDLKRQFRRLEAVGNNDLELIMLAGLDAYATKELTQLVRKLKIRKIRCYNHQQRLLRVGALVPVFLLFSMASFGLDELYIARICAALALVPLLVLVFQGKSTAKLLEEIENRDVALYHMITNELDRRRSGVA